MPSSRRKKRASTSDPAATARFTAAATATLPRSPRRPKSTSTVAKHARAEPSVLTKYSVPTARPTLAIPACT